MIDANGNPAVPADHFLLIVSVIGIVVTLTIVAIGEISRRRRGGNRQ